MKAKLIKREEIVKDFWQIEFEQIDNINFEPGQFFNLTLPTLQAQDGRGNSRYFGFTTTPGKPTFQMLMKQGISDYKKHLLSLPLGSEVEIDKIGAENNITKNLNTPLIFIAGGVGIAPVISMIRFYFEKNLNQKLVLIYTNDGSENLPFINELQEYSTRNVNFKLILANNLDEQLIKNNLPDFTTYIYFIRGTRNFVINSMQIVKSLGIEVSKISMEIFTGY